MSCEHELGDQDRACAEGLCPLCLKTRVARLIEAGDMRLCPTCQRDAEEGDIRACPECAAWEDAKR